MLFNSFQFLLFFVVTVAAYFAMAHKYRVLFLLLASCYFYMAFVPIYILILGFTICIDYFAGIAIEQARVQRRKWFLIISIIANVGVLCVFKYYNFFIDNINTTLHGFNGASITFPSLAILLPIGLSFHTFQAMSYTIEVYRGKQKAETNFIIYALYVMFFPQLVAGPIERPQNMLHQFKEKHFFNYDNTVSGLRLIIWGIFKKMVIADRLATQVNEVYNHLPQYSGIPLILATLFFTIQIYCDFSGYSDIAIGCARIMGFKLMQNFNLPYYAQNISEFWRRWHISLSTWFRDYLYFPLGGNKETHFKTYRNLLIVFMVSGLWHGANWTYIIWGILHGLYLLFWKITADIRKKASMAAGLNNSPYLLSIGSIFCTFVATSFAWIFFRANNMKDALYVVTHLFKFNGRFGMASISSLNFCTLAGSILAMEIVQYFYFKNKHLAFFYNQPRIVQWGIYALFLMAIVFLGDFGDLKFIYFQF